MTAVAAGPVEVMPAGWAREWMNVKGNLQVWVNWKK